MKTAPLLFAAALLVGCPKRPVVSPPPDADASTLIVAAPEGGNVCAVACAVLDEVGCPEARPSAMGQSCEALCLHDMANGAAGMLHPECIADAGHTLAEMNRCGVRCRRP